MQRRWAAICLAFFLVVAAGAYSVMAVAEEPGIDIEGETFWEGESTEVGGTTYTIASIDDGEGTIEYEEVVEDETTFEADSTVEYQERDYTVVIPDEDPAAFELVEQFDVEAILADDPDVENETIVREDENEYVVYRDGTTELLEDYLPEPDRQTFTIGSTLEHENVTKTVDSIAPEAATLTFEEERTQTISLDEGRIIELGGTDHVVTFVDEDTVMLSTDIAGYETAEENQEYFHERMTGLLYVVIFSLGATVILGATAFLPRRG